MLGAVHETLDRQRLLVAEQTGEASRTLLVSRTRSVFCHPGHVACPVRDGAQVVLPVQAFRRKYESLRQQSEIRLGSG